MALATASGYEQYSGSPTNYIPKIYAKKVLVKYYATGVLPAVANTDYAGQIKEQGDEVIIRTRPTVLISDYTKGGLLQRQSLKSDSISMLVDKAKSYCFLIDAIDSKQSDIVLDAEFISDAGYQMVIAIETPVLADIYSSADAANQGSTAGKKSANINLGVSGAPLQLTKSNILDVLVDLKTVLTEQDVPDDGKRYLILPPRIAGLIDKSDLKNAAFSGKGESTLTQKNGRLGYIAGFNIHESNLMASTADGSGVTAWNMIFGHKDALCFVTQLVKNRSLEVPDTYGRQYDGLQVYGYKVVKAPALGWLYGYTA
jgi:hypothetical protein